MLKKVENRDIIYLNIRWDYMNNKTLISTAMLSAYWEKEKKDTLDLIDPFIKYSIAKTTTVGNAIDIPQLSAYFKSEFGYDNMPSNVITLILNRLSPTVLTKNRGSYFLNVSLDEDVRKFEKRQYEFTEHSSKVASALKDFLNENLTLRNSYNEENALQALVTFFTTNGLCLVKDTILLEALKKKDDALNYAIAQFILKENAAKSIIFSYIIDMVKGFYVSTAISLQPQNPIISQSTFKGLKCYIDTRIIIDALGLHLPEAKEAANELLNMLKEKGAKLCCFQHNYLEIDDIITAYKNGLQSPYSIHPYLTLESWDAQNYTVTDVERYQNLLSKKIKSLGIDILEKPSIDDILKYPFNYRDLKEYILKLIPYKNHGALEIDIDSIASILLLRNGNKSYEIEKSGAIFVTSNIQLSSVANTFLHEQNICDPNKETMPIITDMDLSSIVWLKCYSTHQNYPAQRLIENAVAALEPTPAMLNVFFDFVDKIKFEGGITDDEAAILRSSAFCRKELSLSIKGDANIITEQTVYDVKDKLKQRYIKDADRESELNYKKYVQEREKQREIFVQAMQRINDKKSKIYNIIYKPSVIISWIILIVMLIVFGILSFPSIISENYNITAIILFLFGLLGTIDMLWSKLNLIKRFIRFVAKNVSEFYSDKKKSEYESFLSSDFNK